MADGEGKRIAFVTTRCEGTDGVSLEIAKWTEILERMGHQCFFIAGSSDRSPDRSYVIPLAHFRHPVIREINRKCFGSEFRSRQTSSLIRSTAVEIKDELYRAVAKFDIEFVIAENCLTIPINIPLGVALVELLIETGLPVIAHHHDFVWERERFLINAVPDYISAFFPPPREEMLHVVINSVAGAEFGRRTGMQYRIIPNVMNFEAPPPPPDDYARDLRREIGLKDDDVFVLQPTRVVPRKGIEHSIELIWRLKDPRFKLVFSHGEGDEGFAYSQRIREYAAMLGVPLIFANDRIQYHRGHTADGKKVYSVWDAFQHADLVTYPSTYEGFGNAFLEAVYFKKPIFCNRYAIYRTDIEPCGFRTVCMEGFLTHDVVEEVLYLLENEDYRRKMVEHNYEIGRRLFSYERVEEELRFMLQRRFPQTCRVDSAPEPRWV
ncbi:MAG: glycosyltransferase family 4 protein [Planctomycetes bacterium]|nr:glycosyltransferase family 4 protein [Planctomycetota bacterium]